MQVDYSKQIASAFYDHTHKESVPTFLFALREDLKDNKEVLPIRVTAGSAGWDVSCAFEDHKDLIVHPGQYLKIPLGFRCIAPTGWWLELKSRSSSFTKKKLHALYGTIDQDYRGFCYYCAKYDGDSVMTIKMSEKIGQIIPIKLRHMEIVEINNKDFDYYVEQEHNNERKEGGFGSTGV